MADLPKFRSRTFVTAGSGTSIQAASNAGEGLAKAVNNFERNREAFKQRAELQALPQKRADLVTLSTDFQLEQDRFLQEGMVDGLTPQERFLDFKDQRIDDFRNRLTELQQERLAPEISRLDNNARIQSAQLASKFTAKQTAGVIDATKRNFAILSSAGVADLSIAEQLTGDAVLGFQQDIGTSEEVAAVLGQSLFSSLVLIDAEENTKTPERSVKLIELDRENTFEKLLAENKIDLETFNKTKDFVDSAKTNLMENVRNNIRLSGKPKEFDEAVKGISELEKLGLNEFDPVAFGKVQDEMAVRKSAVEEIRATEKVRSDIASAIEQKQWEKLSLEVVKGNKAAAEEQITESVNERIQQFEDGEIDRETGLVSLIETGAGLAGAGFSHPKLQTLFENTIATGSDNEENIAFAVVGMKALQSALKGSAGLQAKDFLPPNSQALKLFDAMNQGFDITPERFKLIRQQINDSETRPDFNTVEDIDKKVTDFAGFVKELTVSDFGKQLNFADGNAAGGFSRLILGASTAISDIAFNIASVLNPFDEISVKASFQREGGIAETFSRSGKSILEENPQMARDLTGIYRQIAEKNPFLNSDQLKGKAFQQLSQFYGEDFTDNQLRISRTPFGKSLLHELGITNLNEQTKLTRLAISSEIDALDQDPNTELLLFDIDGNAVGGMKLEDIKNRLTTAPIGVARNTTDASQIYSRANGQPVANINRKVGLFNDEGRFLEIAIERNGVQQPLIVNDSDLIKRHVMPFLRDNAGVLREDVNAFKEAFENPQQNNRL